MRTWTCAAALLLVLASSASAFALQHQSQCVLPTTWETEVDQQAFANANSACPKAAGRPDSTACLPCVCAAMNLFGDALTHATALTSPRPDMTTTEGTTFASDLFGICIDDNFGSFAQPHKVQQGLKDCLTSADAFISGAQMMEFCGNWGKQAMLTSEEEPIRHVIRDAVEIPHKNVISAAANHARAASEAHARLMHEERFLQQTLEESSSSFEESSGEEILPPPGVYPPPPYGTGAYPPLPPGAVYPPIAFPPPPPAGGAATISTSNVMLQMAMAFLSAVLLAGVMMA